MSIDLLSSVPFIFMVCVAAGLIVYFVGSIVGRTGEKMGGKVAPYACGEELPPRRLQVDVEEFLIYAVYFLIFDVFALILATSLGTMGYFPLVYTIIVLMAAIFLRPLRRRE